MATELTTSHHRQLRAARVRATGAPFGEVGNGRDVWIELIDRW